MKRKGRKGGRFYICPNNLWVCWAYSESEAKQLLDTENIMLRKEYNKHIKKNSLKKNS